MDNKNHLLKVGIYLRLSDEDKNKTNKLDDSESIKNQRNLLMSEIEKRKDFILVDEYCDEDLSGAGTFRPEFERLIKDCENGRIDVVLCKSQSRFSRDMEIIEKYIHNKFLEWNIRFIGLADNADTENTGNKKSRQINGLVNEWYLEDISNNIRSAFKAKMKNGEFISPFAPFGYKISPYNNNKLIIDPSASKIVKDIYYLYLKGLGFTSIAKYLNNNNVPSPSLYKYQNGIKLNIISNKPRNQILWSANAIKKILTNEIYLGHLIQGKRTTISYKNHKIINNDKSKWIKIKNTHEPIIDEDTFNKVQDSIKERTKPLKNTGKVHLFSGKVFCLECNNYIRKKNSTKHQYLVCSNTNNIYNKCSNKSSIRYDILENIILKSINKKIKENYDYTIIEKEYLKNTQINYIEKINLLKNIKLELENKISKTKNYLKNLYKDKADKIITNEQFENLINEFTKDKNTIEIRLKKINNELKFYNFQNKSITNYKEKLINYQRLTQLDKITIDEFIDKIYIGKLNNKTNTRDIYIEWNFKEKY